MLIEKYKNKEEIVEIVNKLGEAYMRRSSHGYIDGEQVRILDAAQKQANRFSESLERNAAISVMSVVLAANRNYERQVRPHIVRLYHEFPSLSFDDLYRKLDESDYVSFKEFWGHKDKKKYWLLKEIVGKIKILKEKFPSESDASVMRRWAKDASLNTRKQDIIGGINNVGIATFQHLRLIFGVDTVKPDQRVSEVLEKEFGVKLTKEKVIQAVEEIAAITNRRVIEIDQIFVKYGSGYYVRQID